MKRSPMPARKTGLKATTIRASGKRKAKPANTAQRRRWDVMRELGCIACHMNMEVHEAGYFGCPMNVEMHHLLSGGRRIGHDATIALCHWHHQAKRFPEGVESYAGWVDFYGPSLERSPRWFHDLYGSDGELLAMQNELILKGASK